MYTTSTDAFAGLFAGSFSLFFCCIYIFFGIISIGLVVLWIWMLIDIATRDDSKFGNSVGDNAKLIWLLIVLFTGSIGALIYYFVVYKKIAK